MQDNKHPRSGANAQLQTEIPASRCRPASSRATFKEDSNSGGSKVLPQPDDHPPISERSRFPADLHASVRRPPESGETGAAQPRSLLSECTVRAHLVRDHPAAESQAKGSLERKRVRYIHSGDPARLPAAFPPLQGGNQELGSHRRHHVEGGPAGDNLAVPKEREGERAERAGHGALEPRASVMHVAEPHLSFDR